ncbi:MAG TPA: glycosyltransferase family 39 protein [Chroococcidiopsis sp.]
MEISRDYRPPYWQTQKAFGAWFWSIFALLAIAIVSVVAMSWISAHPYGTNYDEANYINRAYQDVLALRQGGPVELVRSLLREDRERPPAYRLLVLPLTLLFGASPALLRVISWVSLLGSLGFIFLAARRIAGLTAGAFAVVFLMACPIVVGPNMRFYVDYTLYLAIAATLYYLLLQWNEAGLSRKGWIGLGLSLGLGGMAKPTIAFIIGPILLLTLVLSWRKIIQGPSLGSLWRSFGLAILVMLPWWGFNLIPAVNKAFRSGGNINDALGPRGAPETLIKWFYVFAQSILGPALTVLVLLILATFAIQAVRKQLNISFTQTSALWMCFAGALPLPLIAMFGVNHNPRLIAPLLLPLAVAIGIIAVLSRWAGSKWLGAIATAMICYQLVIMVSPTPGDPRYQAGDAATTDLNWGNPSNVMQRTEQWDWSTLYQLCQQKGIDTPDIAYLGLADTLNPPQINYPWVLAGKSVKVISLWITSDGPIDWDQVMKRATSRNVVITVPGGYVGDPYYDRLVGTEQSSNQHNAELAERMAANPDFSGPFDLSLGRFTPISVSVFLKNVS